MVMVYVGPKSKRYFVHKPLLTQYEWFRKRIVPTSCQSLSRDSITLNAEDPKVFELLVIWLYRKKLNAISTTDEAAAKEESTLYIDLYLRACAWRIYELQNAVIDRLRARQTCELGWFPRNLINKIYENTNPRSPLRSYIVDSFIHKSTEWNEASALMNSVNPIIHPTRTSALKDQLDAGNQEFVLECYEALFQLCAKSKIRDPDRKTGCSYHKHEKKGKCSL